MANNTTTSYVQEDLQADECRENIPPDVSDETGTSKLKVVTQNETLHSSVQLYEENKPVCDPCAFTTQAPTSGNSEVEAKPGCQSALTPILKSLNIDNAHSSSQLLKCSNSPQLSFCFSSMNFSQVNCHNSTSQFGRLYCDLEAPLCLIEDECLPEVSNLDFTYLHLTTNDSVLPENEPSSSKLDNDMRQVRTNAAQEKDDPVEVSHLDGKMAICSKNKNAPSATGIIETELTLLDATNNSEFSPVGQINFMDITQHFSPADHLKDRITVSEPGSSVAVPNEDLSNASVHSVKCVTKKTIRTSLDATMVSVLEKSDSLSETSEQKKGKPETPDKAEVGAQPANITQNISSSNDMSAQGAHLSSPGVKCNTSSARVPSEVHSDPAEDPNLVKTECEEVQTSCDIKSSSVVSQQSHTLTASKNGTFPLLRSSNTSATFDCTSTTSVSPDNKTFDLSGNSSKAESEARDQAKSPTTKTSKKESSQGNVQNATFDRNSLQKTCDTSALGEAVADGCSLQNTLDCKSPSQKNCTVTLSEISSVNIACYTLEKPFSPKVSNLATRPEDEHSSDLPETAAAAAQSNDKKAEKHDDPSVANSSLDSAPGVRGCEFKDFQQSGLPVSESPFNVLYNQSVVNKESTFDLDETLDLETKFLITSTPMISDKTSNSGSAQTASTNQAVPKKLYQDNPNKPADKAKSNIPSNIICDRKTFLAQPVPRALRPPSKVTSHLLKNKPGSTVPERLERVMTGLPVKRLKTQAGVKLAAAEEQQRTSGISSSCNSRSLVAVSKLPTSGLQRPQPSGVPSGISKAAPGLRPPSARSTCFASSSTNKPTESTANPVMKYSQGKKHPLPKGDALPVSKRKKTDTILPSSNTEATSSSSDTTSRLKTLKQPTASLKCAPAQTHSSSAAGLAASAETSTSCDVSSRPKTLRPSGASLRAPLAKPQGHGCARCVVLQEELKQKSDEIQRLKQELQKYKKQEDSSISQS
ncbi:mucin-19 isoform X2 [Austrofundulus limnaeus]|uniref:Mucin-19 isoform X2 n=1 Tax=Austrofundulus limnaeus TaxID=52670 RepID=A0A2I4BNS3_AUSLI|nr:PREDICTED: mucin-19-like isoform X2 [Austrofundulus limnaeus]